MGLKDIGKKKQRQLTRIIYPGRIISDELFMSIHEKFVGDNVNELLIGGAGSGKSFNNVIPNILQANSSLIINDPSMDLVGKTGYFLKDIKGYKLKIFNVSDFKYSMHYNPFMYLEESEDVDRLVNCLMKATQDPDAQKGEAFWDDSISLLISACVFFLKDHVDESERNFRNLMQLIYMAEADEDQRSESELDILFKVVEKEYGSDDMSVIKYKNFRKGSGKTLQNILISVVARFKSFDSPKLLEITDYDELELDKIGDEKTALFIGMSAADDTFNFLVNLMYIQLFQALYHKGEYILKRGYFVEDNEGNRITWRATKEEAEDVIKHNPYPKQWGIPSKIIKTKPDEVKFCHPIHMILDEFANCGQIPEFDKKLATMRKYDIFCTIILQSLSQIENLYEKTYKSIIDNCKIFCFISGQEQSTLEYVSKRLGKAEIRVKDNSYSEGRTGSATMSYRVQERDLMRPEEVGALHEDECLVIVGKIKNPFRTKKFKTASHPNFKYTSMANFDYFFNIEDYIGNIPRKKVFTEKDLVIEKGNSALTEIASQDSFITDVKTQGMAG